METFYLKVAINIFAGTKLFHMDKQGWPKAIIHLDMDAFYPSVEMLDNPELKGKPVIVGGSRERGVVSSASYEARKFGVHSAQPIAKAMRLCPNGIFLPGRMSRYKAVSGQIFGKRPINPMSPPHQERLIKSLSMY
mgnify:CR=1 FL=1